MTVTVVIDTTSLDPWIAIDGRFTFDQYREVLDLVERHCSGVRQLTFDLRHASYVDSAALGLLILVRTKVAPTAVRLMVAKGGTVDEILGVVGFKKLFLIERN